MDLKVSLPGQNKSEVGPEGGLLGDFQEILNVPASPSPRSAMRCAMQPTIQVVGAHVWPVRSGKVFAGLDNKIHA
jgi:hypothetical protein